MDVPSLSFQAVLQIPVLEIREVHLFLCKNSFFIYLAREELSFGVSQRP